VPKDPARLREIDGTNPQPWPLRHSQYPSEVEKELSPAERSVRAVLNSLGVGQHIEISRFGIREVIRHH
jgi:hypothetical protein